MCGAALFGTVSLGPAHPSRGLTDQPREGRIDLIVHLRVPLNPDHRATREFNAFDDPVRGVGDGNQTGGGLANRLMMEAVDKDFQIVVDRFVRNIVSHYPQLDKFAMYYDQTGKFFQTSYTFHRINCGLIRFFVVSG